MPEWCSVCWWWPQHVRYSCYMKEAHRQLLPNRCTHTDHMWMLLSKCDTSHDNTPLCLLEQSHSNSTDPLKRHLKKEIKKRQPASYLFCVFTIKSLVVHGISSQLQTPDYVCLLESSGGGAPEVNSDPPWEEKNKHVRLATLSEWDEQQMIVAQFTEHFVSLGCD